MRKLLELVGTLLASPSHPHDDIGRAAVLARLNR